MTPADMPLADSDLDSELSDEVEILGETHMGKEVVFISDDEEGHIKPKSANPVTVSGEAFRLLDLPGELRVYIYQFVLPHNVTIAFERDGPDRNGKQQWLAYAAQRPVPMFGHAFEYVIGRGYNERLIRHKHPPVETQLFRVNKFVSSEAQAVLYGSNTYRFTVNGHSHFPVSLRSPLIFVKRQRSRLEYFVELLKEHADDENRKSLLQELKVTVRLGLPTRGIYHQRNIYHQITHPPKDLEKFMFGVESLASLRGIKDVEVTGLPEWYAACLQLCIQGKGGEVEEVDWPLVEVRHRRNSWSTQWKKSWVTTRKWYQPTLNWKEFAERNDIPTPDNIDKFWMADD